MRQRPWLVLVSGFGGLLLIMAAAGTAALISLTNLRSTGAAMQQHFLVRNRLLEEIRSHIYLSGTLARDSLLAPEPSGVRAEIEALNALRRENDAALDAYAKSLEPEEAVPFRSLRAEIEAYWKVLDRTFSWTPRERAKYRYTFFYQELVPRRTSMLQIADRVAQLNADALRRGTERSDALFRRLQIGMEVTIAIMLLGGAILAAISTFQILRLQAEARHRFEESVKAKADLQELSARLLRAQEDERRVLSRELHDEVGQTLSAILMETENLLDLKPGEEAQAHLTSIRSLAEKSVDETRNMALLLRPSMLDDFGLVPALNWQARQVTKLTGMRVQVAAAEFADELPDEHKTCIYRVVQEALNNCARHARATAIQVEIRGEKEEVLLTVQDDGSGFDPRRVRGLGLLGMEERVRHLGGSLQVDSQPGRGTAIKIQLPLVKLSRENGNGTSPHSFSG